MPRPTPAGLLTRLAAVTCGVVLCTGASVLADDIYAPMPADVVAEKALDWIDSQTDVATADAEQARGLWQELDGKTAVDLLEASVKTFVLLDTSTRTLIEQAALTSPSTRAPEVAYEALDLSDEFYASQIQLYYARLLTQRKMFDEALLVFSETDPHNVVDPASYFFYKACAEHQLFLKEDGTNSVSTLLQNTEDVPARYRQVASLMEYDFGQMEEKSLGHVASKMNDSARRLELSRSGQRVQKVQGEIIVLLDDIIEKMEQQCQACQGGGKGGSKPNNTNQSNAPADESTVKGAEGPGEIEKKNYTQNRDRWGSLPEKDVAKAENIINKSMPSHYKTAIEGYTERLAKRRATAPTGLGDE